MSLIYNSYLNDFFNDNYFGRKKEKDLNHSQYFGTKCNIYKKDNSFIFDLFLPGFSKSDFNINVDNGVLTISGKASQSDKKEYIHKEYTDYTSFSRSFSLPKGIDIDNIDAAYNSGILTLTVPVYNDKKTETKKITVN